MLYAFNVLTGDTYVHHFNVDPRLPFGLLYGFADGVDGIFDIGYHAPLHAQGFCFAVAQNLEFTMSVLTADNGGNFGGANV